MPKLSPKLFRAGSYVFWSMAALTLPLVLDRMIACPILRSRLGAEAFGGLMWVRSCAMLFGNNLANGFALPLLREFARMEDSERGVRLRVAVVLTVTSTLAVMAAATAICLRFADPFVEANAVYLFPPFVVFAVLRATEFVATVRLRVERAVRPTFLLRMSEGVVLCVGALCLPTTSLLLIACIYVASAAVPLAISAWYSRDLLGKGRWWHARAAQETLRAAPSGTTMVLIDNAQLYAPGLMLGALADASQVTLLTAASIGFAFLVPITNLGQTMLNYLAGVQAKTVQRGLMLRYIGGSLALAVVVCVVTYFGGRELIRVLYPHDYTATMKFFHWFALANGFASVRSLLRPIGVKFSSLSTVAWMSAITLAVQLCALAYFIPTQEAEGAVIAMALSSCVGMLVWLLVVLVLTPHDRADGNEIDATSPDMRAAAGGG